MSDLDRILKGYKPKSSKRRYQVLWIFLNLIVILKLRLLKR